MFILAGRNNPLVPLLGIPFGTFVLAHRWFGRIATAEALVHTFAHLASQDFILDGLKQMISPAEPIPFWGFIVSK